MTTKCPPQPRGGCKAHCVDSASGSTRATRKAVARRSALRLNASSDIGGGPMPPSAAPYRRTLYFILRDGGAVEFVAVRVKTDTLDNIEGTEAAALARLGDAFPSWKAQKVNALRWQDEAQSRGVPKELRLLLTCGGEE